MAVSAPKPVTMVGSHAGPSERTAKLARKVKEIKALELTCCESTFKWIGCACGALTTLGTTMCITVPASTNVALFRCGKLDGEISTPGCHCIVPYATIIQVCGPARSGPPCINTRIHTRPLAAHAPAVCCAVLSLVCVINFWWRPLCV